jgi:hypothetical protein
MKSTRLLHRSSQLAPGVPDYEAPWLLPLFFFLVKLNILSLCSFQCTLVLLSIPVGSMNLIGFLYYGSVWIDIFKPLEPGAQFWISSPIEFCDNRPYSTYWTYIYKKILLDSDKGPTLSHNITLCQWFKNTFTGLWQWTLKIWLLSDQEL